MEHINIRATGIYHPERKVENEQYLSYFSQKGKDVRPILEANGRKTRYVSDNPGENSLTMAVEACKRALDTAELTGRDIDLLVFSSGTPEYLAPTNALKIHTAIGGRNDIIAYDMNANCVGMIVAVDQVSRSMLTNSRCRRALVVGSEQMNRFSKKNDEVTTSNFGDAACAVVLEKAEEGEGESGFVDSMYFVKTGGPNNMRFPEAGMSSIYDPKVSEDQKRIFWPGGIGDTSYSVAADLIGRLLARNGVEARGVSRYFLSQLSLKNLRSIAELLHVGMDRVQFIGDRYGYTGTSSPFLALHHSIAEQSIRRGDTVVFWSIGTGVETCAMLWRY